jgi:thiamine biosynthesis lipoprotein
MGRDPRLLIPKGLKPADVRASRIDAPVRRLSGATMGTGWSLSFVAHEAVETAAVVAALEEAFALVIRQMSGWERGSDLSRFNAAEAGWRDIPQEFAFVLKRALEIATITYGAYDPALGRDVEAAGLARGWRGPSPRAARSLFSSLVPLGGLGRRCSAGCRPRSKALTMR